MIYCRRLNVFFAIAVLSVIFCNSDSPVQNTIDYSGSAFITGRIIYPDTGLHIYLIASGGVDSTTEDPATGTFIFDSLEYGQYILQVRADEFGTFERKIILDDQQYECHDITLLHMLYQFPTIYPLNSQYIDSQFCSMNPPSITDSGFEISINFKYIDSNAVDAALSILPDTVGIKKTWLLNTNLTLLVPYRRLAEIALLEISVNKTAVDNYGETLDHDLTVFYPIDTAYIRRSRVEN